MKFFGQVFYFAVLYIVFNKFSAFKQIKILSSKRSASNVGEKVENIERVSSLFNPALSIPINE